MNEIYRKAIQNIECAFAYHEAVFDDNNKMIDYVFLEVNQSFENLTGLKKEEIINKRFIRDVAQDKDHAQKWIDIYEKVVQEGNTIEFEEYSKELRRYYSIKAYSSENNRFVTLFMNQTYEKKMQKIAMYFMENIGNHIDYDKITEFARDLSGAEYAAFNLFDKDGQSFKTVSICGISNNIKKGLDILGIDLVGKKWALDPIREDKIEDSDITQFGALSDLVGDVIPELTITHLEKTFRIGKAVVAKIKKDDRILGDFILLFKEGDKFKNRDLFRLYLSQLGLYIQKTRLEKSIKTSERRFYTLAEYAPIGFVSCNIEGEVTYANKKLLEVMDSPSYEATKKINLLKSPNFKVNNFSDKLKECMDKDRVITYDVAYKSIWGKHSWVRVHFTPNKENDLVIGANIVVDDISDKKRREDDLKEKVYRDSLTRAYNRYALETILLDRLNEAKDKQLISCVAVVDIDDFKNINDSYGHKAGDSVLKYLATRVKQELREHDLIFRIGGDEFLIYLHDIRDEKNASQFIKRISRKISGKYRLEDDINDTSYSLDVSCSIGVCFFPKHGQTVETLMAKADEVLYKVKKSGKANYCVKLEYYNHI